ncbi:TPA: hypothetical protein ACIJOU_005627, partial [Klebsiella pneumoniae]
AHAQQPIRSTPFCLQEALRHLLGTASGVIEQDDRKIWWATAISSVAIAKQVGYEKFKGGRAKPPFQLILYSTQMAI